MAHLFLQDTNGDLDGVRFISIRDMGDGSEVEHDDGMTIAMFQTDLDGNLTPMAHYGYNWNLEEVIQLRDFLNTVIEEESNAI